MKNRVFALVLAILSVLLLAVPVYAFADPDKDVDVDLNDNFWGPVTEETPDPDPEPEPEPVTKIEIYESAVTAANGGYTCSLSMRAPEAVKGTFIISLYADGRYAGCKVLPMTDSSADYKETDIPLTAVSTPTTYKIMFVSGVDSLKPLCENAAGNVA